MHAASTKPRVNYLLFYPFLNCLLLYPFLGNLQLVRPGQAAWCWHRTQGYFTPDDFREMRG